MNTSTGRSAVTSQMVPPSPTAVGGQGAEIYSLQEKVVLIKSSIDLYFYDRLQLR